jgi:hypothetical protein
MLRGAPLLRRGALLIRGRNGPGSAEQREERCTASGTRGTRLRTAYAMNMRAADASVSRPPKAMKIFPISEVWPQAESSELITAGA